MCMYHVEIAGGGGLYLEWIMGRIQVARGMVEQAKQIQRRTPGHMLWDSGTDYVHVSHMMLLFVQL